MRTEAACCPKCTFQRARRRAHSPLCAPLHSPHEKHTPMPIITAKQAGSRALTHKLHGVRSGRPPRGNCPFRGVHSQTWGVDNPTHGGRNATQCINRAPPNLEVTSSHLAERHGEGRSTPALLNSTPSQRKNCQR